MAPAAWRTLSCMPCRPALQPPSSANPRKAPAPLSASASVRVPPPSIAKRTVRANAAPLRRAEAGHDSPRLCAWRRPNHPSQSGFRGRLRRAPRRRVANSFSFAGWNPLARRKGRRGGDAAVQGGMIPGSGPAPVYRYAEGAGSAAGSTAPTPSGLARTPSVWCCRSNPRVAMARCPRRADRRSHPLSYRVVEGSLRSTSLPLKVCPTTSW